VREGPLAEIHQSGDWGAENWLRFSQSLRTARSREETVRALTDVIAPYGYTTFIYGRIFGAPIDPLTTPVVTNLSSDWMQYYTEQNSTLRILLQTTAEPGPERYSGQRRTGRSRRGSGPKNMRSSARPRAPLGWGLA
jgi:hypothetical protein